MEVDFVSYLIAAILLGYFLGCMNGAQIVGKMKNVNIRTSGVKNAGASNAVIVLGWKYGVIVALIDILKAVIPIIFFGIYLTGAGVDIGLVRMLQYITGTFVIIGHNFPIQMKFLGGKGTASAVGMMMALNWKVGFISILILIFIAIITNYLVFGVFSMYLSFLSTTFISGAGNIATLITVALFLLSLYMHRENIIRIKNKTEPKLLSVLTNKGMGG